MKFIKRINEITDSGINFLWDFFIDLKDDGLDVDIDNNERGNLFIVKIRDDSEVYGHVWVSLEHKKPVADVIKRLLSINEKIIHGKTYDSYKKTLTILISKKIVNQLI